LYLLVRDSIFVPTSARDTDPFPTCELLDKTMEGKLDRGEKRGFYDYYE
jgi:hypothetical protein